MTRGFLRFLRGNTIALIALFLALGGTTYAAVSLPANSVGAKQLKKNAVINKKIKANAVTGGKVKNDSVTGADVVEGSLGTVPSATNATHATSADTATNATNATNATTATNANALGGLGPNAYQKVPTSPQHFTIPATALVDQDGAGRAQVNGSPLELCTVSGGDRLQAPVHLPQGATVTKWSVDYRDDSAVATGNGSTWLTRVPLFGKGGSYGDMFAATLPNTAAAGGVGNASSTTPFSGTAGLLVVDNTKYAYTVITAPAGAAAICSLDVTYTVPQGFAAARPTRAPSGGTPSNG